MRPVVPGVPATPADKLAIPREELHPMGQTRSEMVALNADVVGFSQLIADDVEAMTARMDELRGLVAERVRENDGSLVDFVGDNFMAVFGNAMDAMRAAIAITTDIETTNETVPGPRRARFRMGMDQGVLAVSGDAYFGDAMNIAARVQALARPGGISVSGRVYQALDEPELRFRPIGRRPLKGIPEAVEIYEFADLPRGEAASSDHRSLALESPTVAVLPIHAEGVDESLRATAEVIRLDLIHRLARIPQLKVVDTTLEPASGGARGSARYVIETGLHQAGDNVRIYAEVLDVTTMNIVKSHKLNTKAADLFALSDEFADKVGRAIEVDVVVGEPAGLYAELDDPVAIEQVYLGWYHITSGTPEGWARSLELFGQVARSHPEKAYGLVLLAYANLMGATNGWAADPDAAMSAAQEQARAGFAVGDPTGMAQTVEAAILMSQRRGQDALEAIESAEIQRPTCDATYGIAGSVRRYLGQWQQAVDLTDQAMRLTAVNKPWYPTVQACSLFMGGRVEQAATMAEMVLEYQPQNLEALLVLAAAQVEMGLDRRARATAGLVRERYPTVDVAEWLDSNPYESTEMVDRWKRDLVSAGAIASEAGGPGA
jgi:adenylate cyclase